jgi:hypothetical protein
VFGGLAGTKTWDEKVRDVCVATPRPGNPLSSHVDRYLVTHESFLVSVLTSLTHEIDCAIYVFR